MKTHLIIQARMNSSRLPGKVLKSVLGKPLLQYQIERLTRTVQTDGIIIATTISAVDDAIVELCDRLKIPTYRGSESDVLNRYAEAAQQFDSEVIIRITSDCPLIDPELVDRVIRFYQDHDFDYVVTNEQIYPRGMDIEIFSSEMLHSANLNAQKPHEREHVTPYFYQNPNQFSIGTYTETIPEAIQAENCRLTVDTIEDFQLIQTLIEFLYPLIPNFDLNDITQALTEHPEWKQINQFVIQKSLQECSI
jgi:spore coat polysaccharide biosynthesis protein SpsF